MAYEIKHLELVEVPGTKRRSWWKKISIAVVVSVIAALVSVGTVTISVLTLRQQMADKDREVLNQALTLATDKTGGADRRVAGIWALNYYWSKPQYSNLVASTLTALLALNAGNEGSLRPARCAAAEVIGNAINIEPPYKDGTTEVTNVSHVLYGEWNGKYSLGLVTEENKLLWNMGKHKSRFDEQATNTCMTALDATREAVRKNWKYLRSVNLADTHLERIQLYLADLNGTGFNRANLKYANFRCANLQNADFTDSNWQDILDLQYANVKSAKPDDFRNWAISKGARADLDESLWITWLKANASGECKQVLAP